MGDALTSGTGPGTRLSDEFMCPKRGPRDSSESLSMRVQDEGNAPHSVPYLVLLEKLLGWVPPCLACEAPRAWAADLTEILPTYLPDYNF